ncbi:MAG TPA: DUF1501 domain-containing protein, partial [Planctomycetaceae bacterium]|nr:DUF1501 domain-containing protein [Planctomycetaceae bacterium]
MLRILGSARTLCDQITRRELLQAGGLGIGGLTLASLLRAQAEGATGGAGFGQAKRCILLYLYGAPSQLETFDMKPEAPVEIRGTMGPIPSSVPGLDVCEYLPETARIMDRTTVVRSVTHPFPLHGVAFATSGIPAIDAPMELAPHDPRHHPYFGSCVEYIQRQSGARVPSDIPQNIALPFPFSTQRTGEVHRAGPYAAYLGAAYNPVWTEYSGHATRSVEKTLNAAKLDCFDPYVACSDDSHFKLALTTPLADVTLDRLDRRRTLLQQFEQGRGELDQSVASRSLDRYQEMAFALISSRKVGEALDVRREPVATRDLYGRTLFGQACLAARRMVEAGSRMVSVFWDEYGLAGDAWDTHWNHFARMQDQLMPGFDRAFSGLILDLERRGLLDDSLVAVLSDHGRTPKLNNAKGGGRDHWSRVYSAIFAGGGIARGRVVGASDRHASDPTDRPVSPKDLLATM